ncbi:hypothetical protein JKF63_06124 [Porcisia hertigi]|uniref:Uncharacterized protein n=1 Tax=Porcisia hertigi TaxID=2761500 RepID=A0A836IP02_9TRYP|nr:hypothetical protein JKF63_06124 [Porcisia hertigi]
MCAWAAHAVYQYDHGLLRYSEAKAKTQQIDQHKAGATADVDHSENTLGSDTEAEEERVLWSQGQQLSRAFCASVVPLVATLCSKGEATTSVVPRLPASHEVEQWIFLSIIFSDAEFRVSPYSGTVSYPALPSMLLATIDPMRDREVAKLCYALQWGSQAKATAYAGFCQAGASDGATYLSSTTSRKQGHLPSFPLDTAREQAAPGMDNFVWLDGAAGSPTWTTAHGQYLLHSALTSARKSFDESVIGAPASSVGLSADEQLRKTIAASAEQHHTSGHPLVDVMLQVSSAAGGVTRSRGCPSSDAHASARGGGKTPAMTRGAAAAAAQPPALGWNEGKKGADVATSFVTDASDDGTFAVMMGDLATRGLSAGAMCEINRRLIAHLFRKLTALPVSLARLSTVVRWNLSVAYAGHYRSFFYFLLLTAANPMVHRMADGRRHRRRANVVCADVWAEKHADSNESGCRLEDEVCNALAQYDPCTFRGFQDRRSTEGGGTMAALRRAFAADADVTKKCEYTASDVMEVMCIRVLPHRRPGQRLSAAAAPGDSTDDVRSVPAKRATFCGYPLHFVEVLPTWRQTPEEVLQYLWLQQDPGHLSSINTNWLEKNEEPYILAFSLDRGVLDRRLRLVVDRYLDLTRRAAYPTVSPNDAATRRVTLHELGLMTLWTHEYGAEMSAELLFVLLLLRHDEVRMHPPLEGRREFRDEGTHTRLTTTSGNSHTATTPGGYGSWTVEFLPQ